MISNCKCKVLPQTSKTKSQKKQTKQQIKTHSTSNMPVLKPTDSKQNIIYLSQTNYQKKSASYRKDKS